MSPFQMIWSNSKSNGYCCPIVCQPTTKSVCTYMNIIVGKKPYNLQNVLRVSYKQNYVTIMVMRTS